MTGLDKGLLMLIVRPIKVETLPAGNESYTIYIRDNLG